MYGTDDGVYISDLREINKDPVKVLALLDVFQVDVLEDYQLLIVLSGERLPALPPSFVRLLTALQSARSSRSRWTRWTTWIRWRGSSARSG